MGDRSFLWKHRLSRLKELCGDVNVTGPGREWGTPLIALTSSRLGRDPRLHRMVCQYLRRSLLDCERRGADLLVASGSAIEPWADRAAELLGVTCHKLSFATDHESSPFTVTCHHSSRPSVDSAVIALADRVDALFVRRGGAVARCLKRRLALDVGAEVRVAVTDRRQCAAANLIAAGAVGWMLIPDSTPDLASDPRILTGTRFDITEVPCNGWTATDGEWLVHCTRRRDGPWPHETLNQYRDAILLGARTSVERGPLDSLIRILHSGRLVASAIASSRHYPVVCFSALSLESLMQRRCFRPQLGRWDYEPYGVAIQVSIAKQQGVQPVIYGERGDRQQLASEDRHRFHPHGTTYDWREEREWRSPRTIDLREIRPDGVRVFALGTPRAHSVLTGCGWPVTFLSVASGSR